jgi:phosphoribosylformimino-5-aminoimidazole carboxamide ribotide isomerase
MQEIIPAIDIRAGKCVRLRQGQAEQQTVYGADPVTIAQRWAAVGASLLHVVDLDGAFSGQLQNFPVIQQIVNTVSVPVQIGGGLRDLETIQAVLDAGVSRVVLGTSVLERWELLVTATARFPDRICVGIDSREGRVALHGWQMVSQIEPLSLAREVATTPVAAIIYTDITRDGTLHGPNIAGIAAIAREVTVPIIASGGVSQLDDLRRLAELESLGVVGVIVGKALYEGHFDYQQACAVLRSDQ